MSIPHIDNVINPHILSGKRISSELIRMTRPNAPLRSAAGKQRPQDAAPRRLPTQQRSRARVEHMLDIATDLIAAAGSDALRMSEVAEKAGVSIGSLYQYFPDKTAIIRTLAERYNAQGRACVAAELAAIGKAGDLPVALERVTDGYYAMFIAEPVMLDIWSGTQADKVLQEMDAEDGRAHAALLAAVMQRLYPKADPHKCGSTAFLLMHLIAATVRLAITLPRAEGNEVIATFKQMALKDFRFRS
jgi:AcrR family transcriptional regulator